MNREEILRKAQSQSGNDEMQLQAEVTGGIIAFSVGIIMCLILMGVKVFAGELFCDVYGMLALMASAPHFYCWKRLKKKEEFWNGFIWFVVGLLFTALYIINVLWR